jgi:glycosyltransferase involved in cell wall biosynthesis
MFQNAIALVMFSEMEGFGIPVLEAMQLGTPVISSDQGALKEVVGSGGLLVPQDDREALVDAMLRVANDQTLANDLRQRGTERVAAFSWKHCAEQTISAYSACLHSPRTETTPTVP